MDLETKRRFSDRNLMIIGNSYYSGHKEWVNAISREFSHNYLFVKYNSFSRYSKYVPIPYLQNHFRHQQIDVLINKTGMPDNIDIYPVAVNYIPIDSQRMNLGKKQSAKILELIRRHHLKFDLVHSHFIWPQGYSGTRVKSAYDTPLVITAHGYDIYDLPFRSEKWRAIVESVLNQADHIITVSNANAACLENLDVDTPVSILSNGFNPEKFHVRDTVESRNRLGLPLDKAIILMIGNFEPVKGHFSLISAIEEILHERKDLLCILIGDGKIRNNVENEVKNKQLTPYFHFVGQTVHDQIPLWISASDLVVLPSLSEGNPFVMFEALGSGKPFLGTRVGAIPDVIISDEFGYVMDPGNVESIAHSIMKALNTQWDNEKIAKYASQFTMDRIMQKTMDIYQRLLSQ
jgi:glycosyltransferase involved in cell wall biosynthesis